MKALILIDIQNDFMPWGSVGIEKSDEIIPMANLLIEQFDLVVASQDWHPANHQSFAANHPWRKPGQIIEINGKPQLLWTMHCVQDTLGAELVDALEKEKISKIIQKGSSSEVDSYSAFFENYHKKSSDLEAYLKGKQVEEVFIMGLAAEFGVKYTATDAVEFGFKTSVISDACRWFDPSYENIDNSIKEMKSQGIQLIQSADLF